MMPGERTRSSTPLPPWVEHPSLTSTMVPVSFSLASMMPPSTMPPTLAEVRAIVPPPNDDIDEVEVEELLWGPISPAVAKQAGSEFPASSILLRPGIDPELRARVLAEVPPDVIPTRDDTVDSLVERLSASTFLENSHVQKSGCLKRRVRLNETSYSQPRRRSWSVQAAAPHTDDDGDAVSTLMSYTAFGRQAEDWEAHIMPRPVFDLGVELWRVALPFLTAESRAHPPTACQLLLYYVLFNGRMGRHRDNYNTRQMRAVVSGKRSRASLVEGTPMGGEANSQAPNSCVLIWTEGDASMTFSLSFPPKNKWGSSSSSTDFQARRDEYVTHPVFSTRLGAGTLLVFTPEDDLYFCHEASFEAGERQTHRMAFVFRWLCEERTFRQDTGKMKPKRR